jgi:succinate dehydrogenase / fumarate reductase iron-sulfur subunit
MDKPIILQIRRTTRAKQGESIRNDWQEFHVSVPEDAYVLDALEAAWRQDSSLMFRHACHHASCGSCGMRIQGRERLACITPAFEVAQRGIIRLEPLRNFPIVADLVVDISPLAEKLERVKAHVITEDKTAQRFESCIECGLCISACPVAATSSDYLGPAVLAAAKRNMGDPQVRSLVEGQDGVWRCHSAFECTEVCPAGVEPGTAIMNLRKDLLVSVIRRKGKYV